jgi:non-ribosomal peptide synthetase component E (peptide arylation enzyme)
MIDLIHQITGLSKFGTDPATHFVGKDQDGNLVVRLIKKYNLTRGGRAYDATQIEEKTLRFIIQLLAG